MLAPVLLYLLILLLGLAVLDLLLPSLAWRLHVWSQRRAGIEGIERTRPWEWLRIVRGVMMLLLAGGVLLLYRSSDEAPAPPRSPPVNAPPVLDPAQLPPSILDGISADELESLQESSKRRKALGR